METPFLMHHSYHSPTEDNIISTNLSLSVSRDLRTKRREVKFSSNFPPLVFIKNKLISSFSFLFLFTSSSYHYFFILLSLEKSLCMGEGEVKWVLFITRAYFGISFQRWNGECCSLPKISWWLCLITHVTFYSEASLFLNWIFYNLSFAFLTFFLSLVFDFSSLALYMFTSVLSFWVHISYDLKMMK